MNIEYINIDNVKATLADGVLTIVMQKVNEPKEKKVHKVVFEEEKKIQKWIQRRKIQLNRISVITVNNLQFLDENDMSFLCLFFFIAFICFVVYKQANNITLRRIPSP